FEIAFLRDRHCPRLCPVVFSSGDCGRWDCLRCLRFFGKWTCRHVMLLVSMRWEWLERRKLCGDSAREKLTRRPEGAKNVERKLKRAEEGPWDLRLLCARRRPVRCLFLNSLC